MAAMQASRIYLCLASIFLCCSARSVERQSTNDLIAVVAAWKQKTLRQDFRCVLAPEWIGEVEQKAFDDYGKAFITNRPVQRVRLDLAMVVPDWHGGTNLAVGMRSSGRLHTYHTVFREALPSVEAIAKAKDFPQLRTLLGLELVCDAGNCSWLLFTVEPTNRVRVLSVHAGSPMYWQTNTFGVHTIGEAIFRPAIPNSQSRLPSEIQGNR